MDYNTVANAVFIVVVICNIMIVGRYFVLPTIKWLFVKKQRSGKANKIYTPRFTKDTDELRKWCVFDKGSDKGDYSARLTRYVNESSVWTAQCYRQQAAHADKLMAIFQNVFDEFDTVAALR